MWHLIGVTFDSVNDEIAFYVDGFHVGTESGSFSAITDQSSNLIIGANQDKQSYFFNGSIAHVAIYDDVRTEAEMENDYYGAFVGGNVPMIYFHDIENEDPGADIDISYDDFTALIDWLDKVGYTTVVAEEVLLWQQGEFTLPPRPINLQFDDGFDGVYSLAYPYMEERGMRGTIALMTSVVGAPGRMTYEQARELREQENWEIASHSHKHLDLFEVSEAQQIGEFATSDQEIQDNLGFDPVIFLTPLCHMNSIIGKLCGEYFSVCTGICNGVSGAYQLVNKTTAPTYDMRRLVVNDKADLELTKRSIIGYGTRNYWDDGSVWNSLGSLNDTPQYFQIRGEIVGSVGDKLTSISFSSFEATYAPLQQPTTLSPRSTE
jgi:peptidoglycan/xylan/chitin deacetylase (PgdA/CDA1 family)